MLIGILQTGHAPDPLRPRHGDYPDLFERLLAGRGLEFRTWAVVDGEFPPGPEAAEGWLVTGSRHGAYEGHPWIPPLEALIREIRDARRPLVGVCFGHQIVAQALGGRVEKHPGGWSVGRTEYEWGGERVALNAWHQDQVTAVPPGARVIASAPGCAVAALAYDDAPILTVQAHPEFDPGFLADLMAERGPGVVPEPLLAAAREALGRPLDSGEVADRIARVFLEGRAA